MGRRPAPQPIRPPNPFRNQQKIRAPTPIRRPPPPPPNKRACPNKECTEPQIEDGVCHGCGTIVDDSNIVSEVQFGENSQGGAVVQGTWVGPDQGSTRMPGPQFGRVSGNNKEKNNSEAREIMQLLATGLKIPDSTIASGNQILKLAGDFNFIQGRRLDMVVAVCLYSACRKEKPCRVMLIDFADRIQVNVFKLGHTFKELHKAITLAKDGIQPILPEDLIYRFAQKMDFGNRVGKVAEDAVRMAKRMSQDWMVMGRRPSGVCGACLILAARMNNFRRTVMEVVYIVKVTTHTIQKRLEEFKLTPSSALTVEEFINNEFLEQAHDPPSYYEKQEEFIKNKKTRKRKRAVELGEDEEGGADGNPDKRQRTADPDAPIPSVELRRDADGFVIPPQPIQARDIPIDPELIDTQTGSTFEQLADEFGDRLAEAEVPVKARRGPNNAPIHVPEPWLAAERQLEKEITEMISDPNSLEHAMHYSKAEERTQAYMLWLESENEKNGVVPPNMDTYIGEDEFEDDPEVQNCILDVEDSKIKEQLWLNENRVWLRKKQIKEANLRLAKNGPPKATRKRKKIARIGEGQSSPASSAGDAAVETIKARGWSKKINYEAIRAIAETTPGHKSRLGSAATSRAGSYSAESTASASVAGSVAGSAIGSPPPRPRELPDDGASAASGSVRATSPAASIVTSVAETEEAEEPEDDDWRSSLRRERAVDEFGVVADDVEPELGTGDVDDDENDFDDQYDQDDGYGNDGNDDGY